MNVNVNVNMKKLSLWGMVVLFLAVGGFVAGGSDEVTLEGELVCAKCTLHEKDRTECQNVLVVEDNGQKRQYYLEMNSVNEEYGDVCMAKRPVRITGTISEHGGHTWVAPSQIEPIEKG